MRLERRPIGIDLVEQDCPPGFRFEHVEAAAPASSPTEARALASISRERPAAGLQAEFTMTAKPLIGAAQPAREIGPRPMSAMAFCDSALFERFW